MSKTRRHWRAGFIGSALSDWYWRKRIRVVNFDLLTYAVTRQSQDLDSDRHEVVHGDIRGIRRSTVALETQGRS